MNATFSANGEALQIWETPKVDAWQAPKVEEIGIMGGPSPTTVEILSGEPVS